MSQKKKRKRVKSKELVASTIRKTNHLLSLQKPVYRVVA